MFDNINDLVDQTIVKVDAGDDEIQFTLSDGRLARFYHFQDCCEQVWVEDVNGDWEDLLDTPLLVAEERSEHGDTDWGGVEQWTFYTFRTIKGSVDVRWYGTSNGYYSTAVDFQLG